MQGWEERAIHCVQQDLHPHLSYGHFFCSRFLHNYRLAQGFTSLADYKWEIGPSYELYFSNYIHLIQQYTLSTFYHQVLLVISAP